MRNASLSVDSIINRQRTMTNCSYSHSLPIYHNTLICLLHSWFYVCTYMHDTHQFIIIEKRNEITYRDGWNHEVVHSYNTCWEKNVSRYYTCLMIYIFQHVGEWLFNLTASHILFENILVNDFYLVFFFHLR